MTQKNDPKASMPLPVPDFPKALFLRLVWTMVHFTVRTSERMRDGEKFLGIPPPPRHPRGTRIGSAGWLSPKFLLRPEIRYPASHETTTFAPLAAGIRARVRFRSNRTSTR